MTDKDNNIVDNGEDEEIETIVFEDENGKEVEFVEIGCFDYEGKDYVALAPYILMTAESEDDIPEDAEQGILYCEIVPGENPEDEELVPVEDEALSDVLHEKFGKILEDEISEEGEEDK